MLMRDYKNTEFIGPWINKISANIDNTDALLNLGEIDTQMYEERGCIQIQIIGPDDTPYANEDFTLEFDIVDAYPQVPFKCYFDSQVYHLNVE